MPAQSKINMLQKVEKSLEESKGLFVINYSANASTAADSKGGLTVAEAQELRHQLREVGGHMKVYKNNIVKIALANAGLPAIDDVLVGTCASSPRPPRRPRSSVVSPMAPPSTQPRPRPTLISPATRRSWPSSSTFSPARCAA